MGLLDLLPEAQAQTITEKFGTIREPSCKHTLDQDGPEYDSGYYHEYVFTKRLRFLAITLAIALALALA